MADGVDIVVVRGKTTRLVVNSRGRDPMKLVVQRASIISTLALVLDTLSPIHECNIVYNNNTGQ